VTSRVKERITGSLKVNGNAKPKTISPKLAFPDGNPTCPRAIWQAYGIDQPLLLRERPKFENEARRLG